jgi:hypothetical protein
MTTALDILIAAMPEHAERLRAIVGTRADRSLTYLPYTDALETLANAFWWSLSADGFEFWEEEFRKLDDAMAEESVA